MKMFDEDEYIDYTVKHNKVIKEENPDLELMKHYNANLDEEEE